MAANSTTWQPVDLGTTWQGLLAGELKAIEGFCNDEFCYLILDGRPERASRFGWSERDRLFFESVVHGESEKVIALDSHLSPSTVATRLSSFLRWLGLESKVAYLPLMLSCVVHVSTCLARQVRAGVGEFQIDGSRYLVARAPRPDAELGAILSPGEYGVTRLFIEGFDRADIGLLRGTAERTVANQLAATFLKLGVSGRLPLISKLLRAPAETATSRLAFAASRRDLLPIAFAARAGAALHCGVGGNR